MKWGHEKQEVIRSKKLGGTTIVSRGRRKGYKKKCIGGEQILSEVASKNHHRNLKYFSFLLWAKKKKKRGKIYLIFLVMCCSIPNSITQDIGISSHKRCRFPWKWHSSFPNCLGCQVLRPCTVNFNKSTRDHS